MGMSRRFFSGQAEGEAGDGRWNAWSRVFAFSLCIALPQRNGEVTPEAQSFL